MMEGSKEEKPRLILRADGGGGVGMGHLVRSSALGNMLAPDFHVKIASFCHGTEQQRRFISDRILTAGSPLEVMGDTLEEYGSNFLDLIRPDDVVVLDNYYYTAEYEREVYSRCRFLVCLDDISGREHMCDLLLTSAPLEKENFRLPETSLFLGGMKFALLRPEFYTPRIRNQKYEIHASCPGRILLAIGGTDPLGLTSKLLSILCEEYPEARIEVVGRIPAKKIDNARVSFHADLSAAEMVTLMDSADLAVLPTSTVCLEAFSRGLPVAGGYFAENQKDIYHYYARHKLIKPLGNLRKPAEEIRCALRNSDSVNTLMSGKEIDFSDGRRQIQNFFNSCRRRIPYDKILYSDKEQ